MKKRAPRNRTLTLLPPEKKKLRKRILFFNNGTILTKKNISDKTICADLLSVVNHLPERFADLIIVDPPYNLNKDFHGYRFRNSSDENYLSYLRSWFPRIVKCLKPNGSLYLCGDWKNTMMLQQVMSENLFVLNRITWQREKGRGASKNWKNGMEDIWFGVRNEKKYFFDVDAVKLKRKVIAPYKVNGQPKGWEETEHGNFRMTFPSNFWDDITVPYWSMPENTDHPTQKPEKLIAKLILASCPENGIVFDPFVGSGTTSVVAKKLGRHYCGIEMNAEYCCWGEKRILKIKKDNSIQGYHDGFFWERNSLNGKVKRKK
ncbi:MAG: site-specific DNA-methyltransferase [Bacteroidetes bacterium]|nr:site-specific DNA-methyltransferase [Bacteroidota bacterium]